MKLLQKFSANFSVVEFLRVLIFKFSCRVLIFFFFLIILRHLIKLLLFILNKQNLIFNIYFFIYFLLFLGVQISMEQVPLLIWEVPSLYRQLVL